MADAGIALAGRRREPGGPSTRPRMPWLTPGNPNMPRIERRRYPVDRVIFMTNLQEARKPHTAGLRNR